MNDEKARYRAGKTIRTVEYGVRYADGSLEWGAFGFDIDTPTGRQKFVDDRARMFERFKILPVADVEFVKRTVTTKFSAPESI